MSNVQAPVQGESSPGAVHVVRAAPSRLPLLCLVLLLSVAGALDLIVASSMSTTGDEPDFLEYGIRILHFQPDRSDRILWNSKTPISAMNALPQAIAALLQHRHILAPVRAVLHKLVLARLASILSLLFLNWFVYRWSYELYGVAAGLACCFMAVFSPSLVAHGTLVTTDGYFALGVVGSLYFFRRYLVCPTLRNACVSASVLALAQLSKPFAFYLYAVVFGFLVLHWMGTPRSSPRLNKKEVLIYLALAGAFFIAILNIGYTFRGSFIRLKSYQFESSSFKQLQRAPVVADLPVPVPSAYLQGLDLMKYCDDAGLTFGNIYLLGELRRVHDPGFRNFKSYYVVAWFFKEPIALQILFVLSVVLIFKKRSWSDLLVGEGLLLVSAAALVLWQSLLRNSQIGIRNILPALAVEIIVIGVVFDKFFTLSRWKKAGLVLLLAWLCASTMSYFPHMIPYMNEWVVDRKMSYKLLADSNIDWGQNQYLVDEFLIKNPDVKLNPEEPTSGRVLVSINRMVGVHPWRPQIGWLLKYRPVGHVGYGHLLYIVPVN